MLSSSSFRYTRPVLQSNFQLMGCKARHAFKGCGGSSHCGMGCSALVSNKLGGYHVCTSVGHTSSMTIDLIDKMTPQAGIIVKISSGPPYCSLSVSVICDYNEVQIQNTLTGPQKPTKLSVVVAGELAKSVPKEKSDYTAEDISSIAKDAKVRHLLHSAIDNVMSNRVINCKTAKEIWDASETRCQETDSIKKNRKTILTQEYEHFDSKPDESLTGLYDRFVKLLNDLSLVKKEYDLEDSNLKFLLALPESWDLKATTIRDNYNLEEITLDEIYGMLKTYELEMEQRSKRNGIKSRTVALKTEEESPKIAASRKGKGKTLITKSDTESSSSDSDDDSETESLPEMDVDEEMMKLCALMVKGITRIAYRKFRKGKKFSRKGASSDKKGFKNLKAKEESLTEEITQMSSATTLVRKATYLLIARK
ncbi:hypothetical protein AgCh_033056 [Apium graveolens]